MATTMHGPIQTLDVGQRSPVEMGGVFMESVKTAAQRASEFIKSLIFPSHTPLDEPLADEVLASKDPVTPSSIDGLSLSPRVFNCLWRANIRNIETVAAMSYENLLNIRGFGEKALTELKARLATHKQSDKGL